MKSLLLVIVGCSILEISDADCSENWNWESEKEANWKRGWICNDYISNQWCENGGIGSAWNSDWSWAQDADGLDARDVCCACGGKGLVRPHGTHHYYYVGSAGGVCRYASDVITTQEECTSALSWISSGEYWTGRYNGAPAGCSGRMKGDGDIQPIYNKIHGVSNGRGDLVPICKKDTTICETSGCDQCFRNNKCIDYGQYSETDGLTCTMFGGTDCSAFADPTEEPTTTAPVVTTAREYCREDTCNNRGSCVEKAGDYECKCQEGFKGKSCEATNYDQWKGRSGDCWMRGGFYRHRPVRICNSVCHCSWVENTDEYMENMMAGNDGRTLG